MSGTRDRPAAEEITAAAFAKVLEYFATFRGEASFYTLLHAIASNEARYGPVGQDGADTLWEHNGDERCGNPTNEANHVQPKTPIGVRLWYWWRVTINRELPSEEKVRDILRHLKTKGFVDFAGNHRWGFRRK